VARKIFKKYAIHVILLGFFGEIRAISAEAVPSGRRTTPHPKLRHAAPQTPPRRTTDSAAAPTKLKIPLIFLKISMEFVRISLEFVEISMIF
jgi:hypothetical protein